MSDKVKISCNATPLVELNESIAGINKSVNLVNDLLGSIGGGSEYTYDVTKAVGWKNVILKYSNDTIDWTDPFNGQAQIGSGTNSLSSITKIEGIGIKVRSLTGSATKVILEVGSVVLAELKSGEGWFQSFPEGVNIADVDLKSDNYTADTNYANIDIIVIGD